MAATKRNTLVVDILSDDRLGQRQAQDKLHAWLETYGHTASSFGFQFISVGVLTGKRLKDAPSLSNNREDTD